MTFSEARVSQAWESSDSVSTFGTMVNTWLTGSGRSGLRRRALTRRSVISESLDNSMWSSGGRSVDGGGFEVVFFMMELPAFLRDC
ncbi:hypothetical protein D3C86_1756920 [compost metagenome]